MEDATPVPSGLPACSWAWDGFGCGVFVPKLVGAARQYNYVPVKWGTNSGAPREPDQHLVMAGATVLRIARGAMYSSAQPKTV